LQDQRRGEKEIEKDAGHAYRINRQPEDLILQKAHASIDLPNVIERPGYMKQSTAER